MEPKTLAAIIAGGIGAVYAVGKGIETMHLYHNAKQKYKQLPPKEQANIPLPTLKNTMHYILKTSLAENSAAGFSTYKNSTIGRIDTAYQAQTINK